MKFGGSYDDVVGTLAYGDISTLYDSSNLTLWLNDESKFSKLLNKKEEYLDLTNTCIGESELKEYFIEFENHDECRFGSRCIHENEPSCSVKEAVENGKISKKRYDSYIQLLNEIRSGKRRY